MALSLFDDVEQGIARVDRANGVAMPRVLGVRILSSVMAAAAMAFRSLQQPTPVDRMLCIGLGTGALPGFLAHHFPFLNVDVVEIDPVVVRAWQGMLAL